MEADRNQIVRVSIFQPLIFSRRSWAHFHFVITSKPGWPFRWSNPGSPPAGLWASPSLLDTTQPWLPYSAPHPHVLPKLCRSDHPHLLVLHTGVVACKPPTSMGHCVASTTTIKAASPLRANDLSAKAQKGDSANLDLLPQVRQCEEHPIVRLWQWAMLSCRYTGCNLLNDAI
jgi:hypothetical protein